MAGLHAGVEHHDFQDGWLLVYIYQRAPSLEREECLYCLETILDVSAGAQGIILQIYSLIVIGEVAILAQTLSQLL